MRFSKRFMQWLEYSPLIHLLRRHLLRRYLLRLALAASLARPSGHIVRLHHPEDSGGRQRCPCSVRLVI